MKSGRRRSWVAKVRSVLRLPDKTFQLATLIMQIGNVLLFIGFES